LSIYIWYITLWEQYLGKDLPDGWRKRVQESIKDFSPDTKDTVLKIMDSWEGTKSEEKLKELLGHDKAENLKKTTRRTMVI
jgi:hypothetical protein